MGCGGTYLEERNCNGGDDMFVGSGGETWGFVGMCDCGRVYM